MAMKSLTLITATTLLLSGMAVAQVPGDDDSNDMRDRDTMQRDDTMRDRGTVTGDSQARDTGKFDQLDRNGDGQLSAEEARRGGINRLGDHDRNNDGSLSRSEFDNKKEDKR